MTFISMFHGFVGFIVFFFFFKQKTAYEMRISDWSSDVCSSDLAVALGAQDIGELVDAREDMAVARDEIAPDRKEAERLLLRGGAAEADRVMDEIGRASCRERVCQYV